MMNGNILDRIERFLTCLRDVQRQAVSGELDGDGAYTELNSAIETVTDIESSDEPVHVNQQIGFARRPMCYVADELMMGIFGDQWQLLEFTHFDTAIGGDDFFNLVTAPEFSTPELRYLLLMGIAHGFEGRYAGQDPRISPLDEIRDRLHRSVFGDSGRALSADRHVVPDFSPRMPVEIRIMRFAMVMVLFVVLFVVAANLIFWVKIRALAPNQSVVAPTAKWVMQPDLNFVGEHRS